MKRIVVALAIVLAITLITLSLQSCFVPYHDRGDRGDRRDGPGDRRDGPPSQPSGPPMPPMPPHP